LLKKSIKVARENFAFPVGQIVFSRHPRIRIDLNHVFDELSYMRVLDFAEMRKVRVILSLSILEELAQREYRRLKKQLGNDTSYAEDIHRPIYIAFALGLLAGCKESFRRQVACTPA
jgi:hypothetical protein